MATDFDKKYNKLPKERKAAIEAKAQKRIGMVETLKHGVWLSPTRELFRFENKAQWINKAQSWFASSGVHHRRLIAIDAAGRVCISGAEFSRADEEGTYPVVVYEI